MKFRIKRRLFGLMLVVSVFFSLFTTSIISRAAGYNINAAVQFAYENWNNNSSWQCAEFVSRCLIAGGIDFPVQPGCGNFYRQLQKTDGFTEYKLAKSGQQIRSDGANAGKVAVGDVLVHVKPGSKPLYKHAMFVTKVENGIVHRTQRNGNQKDAQWCAFDKESDVICFHYTGSPYVEPQPEPQPEPTPSVPTGSRMESGYDRTLPDGDYIIASAANQNCYLDIEGSDLPAANEENVHLWNEGHLDLNDYDVWHLKYEGGFYTITQYNSIMALDVYYAGLESGSNVQVFNNYEDNDAQQWAISANGRNGYRLQARCNGYSLDIENGNIASNTNVRTCVNNDSDAQSWVFIPYKPAQFIENGRYVLTSMIDDRLELDVAGDSGDIPDKTNVRVWDDSCSSQFNSFDFEALNNGYYKIIHAASGKVLDVSDGRTSYNNNVYVSSYNGAISQQWAIVETGGYGFAFINRCSGMALDVKNYGTANGTNVEQFPFNANQYQTNQTWKFHDAEHFVYYNLNGGINGPDTDIKFYKNSLELSQVAPSREGYTFEGWATSAGSDTVAYHSGDVYTTDANITLFAVWKSTAADNGSEDNGDSGNTDNGNTDNGNTDNGNTDNGNTDNGNTDNGNTENGNSDAGNNNPGNGDAGNSDSNNSNPGNNGSENNNQPVVVTPSDQVENQKSGYSVGDTVVDPKSDAYYMVLQSGEKSNAVIYVKSKNMDANNVIIPSDITVDGTKFVVTEIAANAFKNNTNLKSVIIGKNILVIGKNAFSGCKNLKNIKIKTTALSKITVGKNAFKGIHSKAKVKVPKSKLKSYKKVLKARGISGKKQKITK